MRMRSARQLGVLLFSVCAAAPLTAGDDIRSERVQFERGTSGTTIEGTITGYEIVDYLIGALAGQTMTVEMSTDHSASYFNVLPPDAENEGVFNGSLGDNRYEGMLDLDGDWKVRVYLMRSAARRREMANFTLEIGVAGAADPAAAREANDFGPRTWDARGDLGCAVGGQPMQTAACPFKVIRTSSGGTVFAVKPGGSGTRVLYFENGEWSTDSAAVVSVSKRADLWTLTVSEETYEVPEAVVNGG